MVKCERCEEREAQQWPDYFYIRAVMRYPLDLCTPCADAFKAMLNMWWAAGRPRPVSDG